MTEQEARQRLAELSASLPPEMLAELTRVHEAILGCAAHSEGQTCCLDLLVDGEDR